MFAKMKARMKKAPKVPEAPDVTEVSDVVDEAKDKAEEAKDQAVDAVTDAAGDMQFELMLAAIKAKIFFCCGDEEETKVGKLL